MSIAKDASSAFASGALGGLAVGLTLWALGRLGITQALHVAIAPGLTEGFIFAKVVWGGLWGFLLLLPILKSRVIWRGLLLSLFPTLVQLIYVFPHTSAGTLGLGWGRLTPLVVLAANAVGGVIAAWWQQRA